MKWGKKKDNMNVRILHNTRTSNNKFTASISNPIRGETRQWIIALFMISIMIIFPKVFAANPGHPASSISPGTFESGNFIFPNNLQINQNLTVSNNLLFVDNQTGNVGIGTTAPSTKLNVIGGFDILNPGSTPSGMRTGSDADAGRVWVEYGSHNAPLLILSDYDDLPRIAFRQTGTGNESNPQYEAWIGMASNLSNNIAIMGGNVGIGTTSPVSKLDVRGQIAGRGWLNIWNAGAVGTLAGGDSRSAITFGGSDSPQGWYLGQVENSTAANTALGFWKWSGAGAGWNMVLKDGNVGIGTSDPAYKLDVRSGLNNEGSQIAYIASNDNVITSQTTGGTWEQLDWTMEGFKFNSGSYTNISGVALYIKRSTKASLTGWIRVRLYSDNAGVPGSVLVYGTTMYANRISATGSWYYFSLRSSLTTNTNYWIIIERSGLESDDIYLDSRTDVSNHIYWSGSSWVSEAKSLRYYVYAYSSKGLYAYSLGSGSQDYGMGIQGLSYTSPGVYGYSQSNYGVRGSSINTWGGVFVGASGVYGEAVSGSGTAVGGYTYNTRSGQIFYGYQTYSLFTGNALELKMADNTLSKVFYYNGSAFTDRTTTACQSGGSTFTLLTDTDDTMYFGLTSKFTQLQFDISTAGAGLNLVWEYSAGSGVWNTLTLSYDETKNLTRDGIVTWSDPGASWVTDTVNGTSAYWIRLRTTTNPSTAPTVYLACRSGFTGYLSRMYNAGQEKLRVDSQGRLYVANEIYPGTTTEEDGIQTSRYIYDTGSAIGTNSGLYVAGSVGIGTMNPQKKLDVVGDINATGGLYAGNGLTVSSGTISVPTNSIACGAVNEGSGTDICSDLEEETHASEHDGSGISVSGDQINVNTLPGGGIEISSDALSLNRSCSANQILKWSGTNWVCAADDVGTGMTSWNIAGDSGIDSVTNGQTVTIAGGVNGIDTVESGRTVTINLDWSEVGTDAIPESKIDFDTSCASTNKLYVNGNDLACGTDYTCSSTACTVGSDDTLNGPSVGANLNMNNYLIENIGNAGTDFTSGGGLNLAGNIVISGGGTNTISGNSNFDGGTLYVDATNHRVGIGTTAPLYPLHVTKTSNDLSSNEALNYNEFVMNPSNTITAWKRAMYFNVYVNGYGGQSGNDITAISGNVFNNQTEGTIPLVTGASIPIRIINAGNITTGKGYSTLPILTSSGNMTTWRGFDARSPSISGTGILTNSYAVYIEPQKVTGVTDGYGIYQAGANDRNYFAGSIGIGTTLPTGRLDIRNDAAAANLILDATGSQLGVVYSGGGDELRLGSNNSYDDIVISPSGNVGIGTTAPDATLDVNGAATIGGDIGYTNVYQTKLWVGQGNIHVYGNEDLIEVAGTQYGRLRLGNAWNYSGIYADTATDGSANTLVLGASSGKIYLNGNVGVATASPSYKLDVSGDIRTTGCLIYNGGTLGTCVSDENLKNIIGQFYVQSPLEKVTKLQPVKYTFKSDPNQTLVGLLANEVEKIVPELIEIKDDQKQIKYGEMQWLLLEAIKEQQKQIEQQQKEIDELKNEIQRLKLVKD
ncbi:MAG: tail fiber domain-containing protein [Candidatus Aenigmatarchaeota archaeon]